jgi:hypothetical protein
MVVGNILHTMACAGMAYWKTLIRISCVLAIAVTSVSHVVADFTSVQAGSLSVSFTQTDADSPSDSGSCVERCHFCSVVSFMVAIQASGHDVVAGLIPDGRLLHLSSIQLPATAPPPRALT